MRRCSPASRAFSPTTTRATFGSPLITSQPSRWASSLTKCATTSPTCPSPHCQPRSATKTLNPSQVTLPIHLTPLVPAPAPAPALGPLAGRSIATAAVPSRAPRHAGAGHILAAAATRAPSRRTARSLGPALRLRVEPLGVAVAA